MVIRVRAHDYNDRWMWNCGWWLLAVLYLWLSTSSMSCWEEQRYLKVSRTLNADALEFYLGPWRDTCCRYN